MIWSCLTRGGFAPAVAAAVATAALTMAQPAAAAPAIANMAAAQSKLGTASTLAPTQVQYRGRHWRGGWNEGPRWRNRHWGNRGYWRGPGVAGAIAGAIIGGTIIASQRDYRDAWDRCADTYRSFRWSDGTFQPYGGAPRQICPYLAR